MATLKGRVLGVAALAILIAGCAGKEYRFEHHASAYSEVWPKPPETARIRFVGFITGEANFVENPDSQGVFSKSVDWLGSFLFGEESPRNLFRPQGGYFDKLSNRLYVTDIGHKAVFVFDLAENKLQMWEQAGDFNKFNAPIGVVVNDKREVFVSDSALGFVFKFSEEGNLKSKLGEGILQRPTGMVYEPKSKRLFVADSAAHKVYVFNAEGQLAFTIGGKKSMGEGHFNSPTYLAIVNEKLLVVDTLNARVQMFDFAGKWIKSFGQRGMFVGNMPRPKGVAADSDGNIYIVESYYDHLLIFNKDGEPLLPIGGRGKQPGQFDLPAGTWVDAEDRVYVADMFNSRISVFQYLRTSNLKQ